MNSSLLRSMGFRKRRRTRRPRWVLCCSYVLFFGSMQKIRISGFLFQAYTVFRHKPVKVIQAHESDKESISKKVTSSIILRFLTLRPLKKLQSRHRLCQCLAVFTALLQTAFLEWFSHITKQNCFLEFPCITQFLETKTFLLSNCYCLVIAPPLQCCEDLNHWQ